MSGILPIIGKYGRINSATEVLENVMHCSDSEENAEKEIKLWFDPEELAELIYPVTTGEREKEITVWKS